jgi:hypothetical protein
LLLLSVALATFTILSTPTSLIPVVLALPTSRLVKQLVSASTLSTPVIGSTPMPLITTPVWVVLLRRWWVRKTSWESTESMVEQTSVLCRRIW